MIRFIVKTERRDVPHGPIVKTAGNERMTVPGDKMISIRLTADEWRWVYGVLDGQLDAGACEGGNYQVERDALFTAARKIMRAVKKLRPTNHPDRT